VSSKLLNLQHNMMQEARCICRVHDVFIHRVRDAFINRVRDKSQLDRCPTVSVSSKLLNLQHNMMQDARWACIIKIFKTQLDTHFTHLYVEFMTYLYIEFVTHL